MRARESGIATVLFVLGLFAVLTITAFTINTAYLTYARAQAQASIDAAALAAAAAIPSFNPAGDTTKVQTLVGSLNGVTQTSNTVLRGDANIRVSSTWSVPLGPAPDNQDIKYIKYEDGVVSAVGTTGQATGVTVQKSFDVPYPGIGQLLGSAGRITVSATASVGGPSCALPVLPIVLLDCSFGGSTPNCSLPSNGAGSAVFYPTDQQTAGIFNFDPSQSANASYCKDVVDGDISMQTLCVGSIIRLNNGQVNGCIQDLEHECAPSRMNCSSSNPWDVIVPVVNCDSLDPSGGNVVQDVPVAGFARILITSVVATGSDKRIEFSLVHAPFENSIGGGKKCGLNADNPILIR